MKLVKQEPLNIIAIVAFPFAAAGAFIVGSVIGLALLILGKIDDKTR